MLQIGESRGLIQLKSCMMVWSFKTQVMFFKEANNSIERKIYSFGIKCVPHREGHVSLLVLLWL